MSDASFNLVNSTTNVRLNPGDMVIIGGQPHHFVAVYEVYTPDSALVMVVPWGMNTIHTHKYYLSAIKGVSLVPALDVGEESNTDS